MNYIKLLDKYDDMILYSSIMLPECIKDAVIDIANIMNISVDKDEIINILKHGDIIGVNRIGYFQNEIDKRRFILIDCHQKSDLHKICIRCLKEESRAVSICFNKWVKKTTDEYGQPYSGKLIDWMHDKEYENIINPLYSSLKFNKLI